MSQVNPPPPSSFLSQLGKSNLKPTETVVRKTEQHLTPVYDDPRKKFTFPAPKPQYSPSLQIKPIHIDITVQLDIKRKEAEVSLETTVVCVHKQAKSITLNGINFWNVQVKAQHDISWSYDNQQIKIIWKDEFSCGEERNFTTSYTVANPLSGLYFSSPDENYKQRPTYVITDHETERARYWLACIDHPSSRPTISLKITAQKDFTILASGSEISNTINGDHRTSIWNFAHPTLRT